MVNNMTNHVNSEFKNIHSDYINVINNRSTFSGVAAVVFEGDRQMERLVRPSDLGIGPSGRPIVGTWWLAPGDGVSRHVALLSTEGPPANRGPIYACADARLDNRQELLALVTAGDATSRWTDAELIAALFEERGPACFSEFVGDFAVIVWCARTRTLYAVRDPLGVRGLCLASNGTRFSVASTVGGAARLASLGAINGEFLRRFAQGRPAHRPAPTAIAGVEWVPPGHWTRWRDGRTVSHQYFSWAPSTEEARTEHEASDRFLAALTEAVRCRAPRDSRVGVLLSGGLDSSAVAALAATTSGATNGVYTYSAQVASADAAGDHEYRALVVEAFPALQSRTYDWDATIWNLKDLGPDDGFPMDEPALTSRVFLSRLAQRAVAEGVDVLLTGMWADQVAIRQPYDHTALLLGLPLSRWRSDAPHFLRGRLKASAASIARVAWSILSEPRAWSPFQPGTTRHVLASHFCFGRHAEIINYFDRQARFTGAEFRYPFLDRRLIELTMSFKPQFLFRGPDGHQRKWLLRTAMAGLLPRPLIDRRDYAHMATSFLRGIAQESAAITDLLRAPRLVESGIVNRQTVQALVKSLPNPSMPQAVRLHRLCSLELWMRTRELA